MSIEVVQKAKSNLDVVSDCISLPRNIVIGATAGTSAAIPFLMIAQGIPVCMTGAYTAVTSFWETREAIVKKDRPGIALHSLGTLAGVAQTSLGFSIMTCARAMLAGKVAIAASAGAVITPCLFAVYALFLAKSALTLKYIHDFEQGLSASKNPELFLTNEYRNNPAQIKRLLGQECAEGIRDFADAESLRSKITRECLKAKITHIAVIAICSLGILAIFASIVLATSCPVLAPILFAIGASLWVFVDCVPLHLKIRDLLATRLLSRPAPIR